MTGLELGELLVSLVDAAALPLFALVVILMLRSPLTEGTSFTDRFTCKYWQVDVRGISREPTKKERSPEAFDEESSWDPTFPRRLDDQEGAGTVRRRRMVLSISRLLPQMSRADSSHSIRL